MNRRVLDPKSEEDRILMYVDRPPSWPSDCNGSTPHLRASSFGYVGIDYARAVHCLIEHSEGRLISNVLLPLMHQTVELLSKAIAFKVDDGFDPRKYSHRVRNLMEEYSDRVPLFEAMLSEHESVNLIENLERAYIGVRYAECTTVMSQDVYDLFFHLTVQLLDDLHKRTALNFLPKHFGNEPDC